MPVAELARPPETVPAEVRVANVIDHHQSTRREELNRRLRPWAGWLVGGVVAGVAAGLLWPAVPILAIPLALGGAIAEAVGFVGLVGNLVKGFFKKNK